MLSVTTIMMKELSKLHAILEKSAEEKTAAILQRFFKTGPGEYGEGDKFLGIRVPDLRRIAREFVELDLVALDRLLQSKWHEERLIALFILISKYQRAVHKKEKGLCADFYRFYLDHFPFINNWDLVDLSAPQIAGHYLFEKDHKILHNLAKKSNLWQRRIAIIATFYFIKQNYFATTLSIAKNLLDDKEDLIHKACGWMLREIGKRDLCIAEKFLEQYYQKMPRTMLRYAIEKFSEPRRQEFLQKGKSL